jgi:hypothetical protein
MIFDILETKQAYSYSKDSDNFFIEFKLSPNEFQWIEIGKEYAAASPSKQWQVKDKKLVNVSVTFYDINSIETTAHETAQKLLQSDEGVIGVGHFHKEIEDDFQTYPASLNFRLWLSTKAYNHLVDQLQNKNNPSRISFDIKGLENGGHSPHDRHRIWDIDAADAKEELTVSSFWIGYEPLQQTALDIAVAKIIKEQEQNEKKEIFANDGEKPEGISPSDFRKLLRNMYELLIVIAVLLAIIAFKH